MAAWTVVPCLLTLRAEFDRLAPDRDKGADGTVGDLAHQQESSDHNPDETGSTPYKDADTINEVHALDIDSTGPWPAGRDIDTCVEIIRLRHLRGHDNRLQNIIWRGRVASRSWGWTWQDRAGIGHFDHAHFSAVYTSAQESDTRTWGLIEEDDVSWTDDVIQNPAWRGDAKTNPTVKANYALYATWNEAHAANVALASVAVQLKALTGKDFTDEQAIVAGVLAGLDPAAIAAAIPADLAREVADELAARLAS